MVPAQFLSSTMSFIDMNIVGICGFMNRVFATFIMSLPQKQPAFLSGIYLRVAALASLGIFFRKPASWKIWLVLFLIAVFSFSGAWTKLAYTVLFWRTIENSLREKLLTQK